MRNIFRGIYRFLKQKKIDTSGLPEHIYFCCPLDNRLGIVMQQPHLCKLNESMISSTKYTGDKAILENLYRFLHGINSLHDFHYVSIQIVFPAHIYLRVILNMPEIDKKLAQGIYDLVNEIVQSGNCVQFSGRMPWSLTMKAAKRAAIGSNYRME